MLYRELGELFEQEDILDGRHVGGNVISGTPLETNSVRIIPVFIFALHQTHPQATFLDTSSCIPGSGDYEMECVSKVVFQGSSDNDNHSRKAPIVFAVSSDHPTLASYDSPFTCNGGPMYWNLR